MKLTRHVALILAFIIVMNIQLTTERKVSTGTNSNRKKITSSAGLSAKHKMKQENFRNTQWMALGYNSLFGNPLVSAGGSKLVDTGFTASIFQVNIEKNGLYGWTTQKTEECKSDYQSETIESSEKLKKETKLSVSASGSVPGIVDFSASAGYRNMVDKINNQNKVINISVNKCTVFNADIIEKTLPKFSKNFEAGLKNIANLDFEKNKNKFFEFINNFGTHFVSKMFFGSKIEYLSESKDSRYFENVEKGSNFKLSADSAFLDGGGSFNYANSVNSTTTNNKNFSNRSVVTLGSLLPSNTKHDERVRDSLNMPMPIQTEFDSILNLLELSKDPTVKSVRIPELKKAYADYCRYVKDDLKLNTQCENSSEGFVKAEVKEYYIDNITDFDKAEMKCPPGSALSLISFETSQGKHRRRYRCIHSTSVTKNQSKCRTSSSQERKISGDGKITDLNDLVVECKKDEALTSLNIVRQHGKMNYNYTCCQASLVEPSGCSILKSNLSSISDHHLIKIEDLNPLDSSRSLLDGKYNYSKWRFIRKLNLKQSGNDFQWEFTACNLGAPSGNL